MTPACLQAAPQPGLADEQPVPGAGQQRRSARALTLLCALALCLSTATAAAEMYPANRATPGGTSGVSTERLQRLDVFMEKSTAEDGYLGGVSMVMHAGRVVQQRAYGHRDLARTAPMREDSIFRIYSMTKTVTSVAVLMLMEEGKLALDDPLADYLPEFQDMQVFAGGSADSPRLQPASHAITLRHLLTHTAGFATGGVGLESSVHLLERADLEQSTDLQQFARKLAAVPLAVEPGTRFRYDGTQLQVLGRVVEVVSGQPLDVFLEQRIFAPLGMDDTGFEVPAGDRHRIVDITRMSASGTLELDQGPSAIAPGTTLNLYFSAAGGLYSTAPDFMRFCAMLLQGGAYEGHDLLGRKTVESMMQNQLGHLDTPVTEFSDAEGFGLGGSVLLDPALRGRLGSKGQFGWSGAASTYFTIDPAEQLVAILLMQHLPNGASNDLPRLSNRYYNLVYQALVR